MALRLEQHSAAADNVSISWRVIVPKENDLEDPQDRGGKHGGQAGMPKHSPSAADQGIVRDERRQEHPRDQGTSTTSCQKR
jgi:hypothetical protein